MNLLFCEDSITILQCDDEIIKKIIEKFESTGYERLVPDMINSNLKFLFFFVNSVDRFIRVSEKIDRIEREN